MSKIKKLWEKLFPFEQYIEDLEHDVDMLATMVLDLRKENEKLKGTYRGDEWRIEQFNRNRAPKDQVKTIKEMEEKVKEIFGNNKNNRRKDDKSRD